MLIITLMQQQRLARSGLQSTYPVASHEGATRLELDKNDLREREKSLCKTTHTTKYVSHLVSGYHHLMF